MKWCGFTIAVLFLTAHLQPAVAQKELAQGEQQHQSSSVDVPDFQKHVVPLLGRLGCSSAKCHGSFQGQAGFRLSLFGFDFAADHAALTAASTTRDGVRVKPGDPAKSLLLKKATNEVPHEGGQRIAPNSWEYRLLTRWVLAGAHGVDATEQPPKETVSPQDRVFTESIQPILETHCFECHGFGNRKGGLQLTSRESMLDGGESGAAAVPGSPDESLLIAAVRYDGLEMPPSGKLPAKAITALERWVSSGANWPEDTTLKGAGAEAEGGAGSASERHAFVTPSRSSCR